MNADDHRNLPPEAETAAEPFGGRRFGRGRYTVLRQLGRGGMGAVWLARDTSDDRLVALKFLPQAVADDPAGLANLRRESSHTARLEHPHIVRVHTLHEQPGEAPFLVLEYVDGPTLNQRRTEAKDGVLAWEFLAPLARQLCAALACAHAARVIHRDLKPANLMLDSAGRLKLADFGISAVVSDTMSRITGAAYASGTTAYMSPQQVNGELPRATDDIYSVGATLFELLTGTPPFCSGELVHQVLNKPAPTLAQRLTDLEKTNSVPPEVAATLQACLEKNAALRPQSAAELAQRLGLGELDLTLAPPPISRAPRVLALTALLLMVAVTWWSANEVEQRNSEAAAFSHERAAWHTVAEEQFQSPDETGLPAGWSRGNHSKRTSGPTATMTLEREGGEYLLRVTGVEMAEAAFAELRLNLPVGVQQARITAWLRPTDVPPLNVALESAAGFVCLQERERPPGFTDQLLGYVLATNNTRWERHELVVPIGQEARRLGVRFGFNFSTGTLDVRDVKVEFFGEKQKIRAAALLAGPFSRILLHEDYERPNAQGKPERWGIQPPDPGVTVGQANSIVEEAGQKFYRQRPGTGQTNVWIQEVLGFKPARSVVEISARYRLTDFRAGNAEGATSRPLKVFFRDADAGNLSVFNLLHFDLAQPVNTDWQQVTHRLIVPTRTTQLRVLLTSYNVQGTIDLDDLRIRSVE